MTAYAVRMEGCWAALEQVFEEIVTPMAIAAEVQGMSSARAI